MANTIRIKRRASGAPGAPEALANAELAFNEVDNTLYYGKGVTAGTATTIEAIGGSGAFVALTGVQTISGNKTHTGSLTIATQTSTDNSTLAASTAYVKSQNYLTTVSGTSPVTASVSGSTATVSMAAATTSVNGYLTSTDWATFNAKQPAGAYLTGNESITVSGDATGSGTTAITLTLASVGTAGTYTKVTTNSKGLVTAGTTLSDTDIPTLAASKISDFDTQVRTNRLDQMAAPNAAVAFNSQKITGLLDPTAAQDAATKNYVDATRQGLVVKDAVRAATTANITLTGTQTVDGVVLIAGNRVLVKDQSTGSQNGLYDVSASAWTRTSDSDAPTGELTGGSFVFVQEGTVNADSGFVCTTDGAITVGTTALTFTQFSGAGQITAGAGLTKTGNTLDVGGTTDRITVNTDTVDIASTYAGQSTITTLGTIATGTWQGTVVGPTYGGTGVNNGSSTITIAGNLTHAGAFTQSFTATANTALTLPTTGTLATLAGSETLSNKTLTTPVLGVATATSINKVAITQPATGSTLTIVDGGTLATAGAFVTTLTSTATTNVTLPITGTLATLAGTESLSNKTLVTPVLGTPGSGDFSSGTFTWPTFNQNTSGTAAGLSATLAVGSGGTGATTLTTNGVVFGNGTSAVGITAAGTWDATNLIGTILSVNSSGVPTWTNEINGGTY